MSSVVVIGSQWGDEGKGKVIDVFSAESDLVVRYQGGANAGHTLIVNGVKTVLHLVPSGVLHQNATCIISCGVALDVETVLKEIHALKENGYLKKEGQLLISDSATVLLPQHKILDQAREKSRGLEKIGTTGKGIGPSYEARASRKAVLFGDLFQPETLEKKLTDSVKEANFLIENLYGSQPIAVAETLTQIKSWAEALKPYRCKDTSLIINKAIKEKKKVLFEGAQGTLLDLLHGTYPFVTSSSTLSGSACVGAGVGPTKIKKVLGITKAYTTRVGSGPFPTELDDQVGEHLGTVGGEFGSTTGRRRRCGWIDLVALRYAISINGITNIALMKLDVLSNLDEIKVCHSYELNGQNITDYPTTPGDLEQVTPVYKSLPGWTEDISSAQNMDDLPQPCRDYISFLSKELEAPVDVVSVGPQRDETLWLRPLFE